MKLLVNSKNEIMAYAYTGDFPDSLEFDSHNLPSNFDAFFKPKFYVLASGKIELNQNYTERETETTVVPSQAQQALAALTKQIMELQLENEQQKKINTSLTKEIMDIKLKGVSE
ncbi:DUF2977 domain-containing protein [Ligilactobacillus agilis]|uniref:DUF2977 domain-containing protein n=1 Tax=Ligilactobacillus agilis TaxID=1601 RepID=UPI0025A36F0F|nr:DUF2977 domain-containing protein [Ligilactobacillus agilis]MDM8279625.1 DUF2977 domain-containing protein [Ligilactobacillus agilis]